VGRQEGCHVASSGPDPRDRGGVILSGDHNMNQKQIAAEMQNEERALELQGLVKEFFEKYLNRVEESDSGKDFNPIVVSCCRAMMTEPLNNLLARMAELSGAERRST